MNLQDISAAVLILQILVFIPLGLFWRWLNGLRNTVRDVSEKLTASQNQQVLNLQRVEFQTTTLNTVVSALDKKFDEHSGEGHVRYRDIEKIQESITGIHIRIDALIEKQK